MICPGKTVNPVSKLKVNKRDGTPQTSDKDLFPDWREYSSSLLDNNSNNEPLSELPPPAAQDLLIGTNPPTREETLLAFRQMKKNEAAGLDNAMQLKHFSIVVMHWQT